MGEQAVCLTIAGSDSSAGAGIQRDLKSFQDFGLKGCSVITALTAQNPNEIIDIQPLTLNFIKGQLKAICSYYKPTVIKTGMLYKAEIIHLINDFLSNLNHDFKLIVDPVMIATSGKRLLDEKALNELQKLIKSAYLVCPNIPECHYLNESDSCEDSLLLAKEYCSKIQTNVLLKGGHAKIEKATDYLIMSDKTYSFEADRLDIKDRESLHGTGCALSSAIAANIAKGLVLDEAVLEAKKYLLNFLAKQNALPVPSISVKSV